MIVSTTLRTGTASITMGASGALVFVAPMTIDDYSQLNVVATATGLTFTIPSPTTAMPGGQVLRLCNTGANRFTVNNKRVSSNGYIDFQWTGSVWATEKVRLQAEVTPPVLVVNLGTLISGSLTGAFSRSTDNSVIYSFFFGYNLTTSGWKTITLPNIAGYQAPVVISCGTYRNSGTPTGFPPAPFMGQEINPHYGAGGTGYWGTPNTIPATTVYFNYIVEYKEL